MMSLLNQSEHWRDDGLQTTIKRRKCDIADKFHRVFELPVEANAKSPVEREKSHSIRASKKISYELDVPVENVDSVSKDVAGVKVYEAVFKEDIQRRNYFPKRNVVGYKPSTFLFPKGCMKPKHHLASTIDVHKDLSKLIVESCGSVDEKQEIVIVSNHLAVSRDIVKRALNSYREELAKLKEYWKGNKEDVYVAAAKILEEQQKCVNTTKRRGVVSGVEIGDRFRFRAELYVIGLHRRLLNGIDYMYDKNGRKLATSVVDSGRYENYSSDDVLIYSGEGGNPSVRKRKPMDQKLQGGNEALKNSIGKEVRVIRCYKFPKASIVDVKTMYVYDGLYLVEDYWQEIGKFGKFVFKYRLKRIHGQPKLPRNIGYFPNMLAMK